MENVIENADHKWNEETAQDLVNEIDEEIANQENTEPQNESAESEELSAEEDSSSEEEDSPMTADQLITAINEEYENGLVSSKLKIGKLVFIHCFDSDIEKAKSKSPKKEESYKKVSDHEGLKMDPKELGRCVRAAAQLVELEKHDLEHSDISFYGLLEIAKLPEEGARLEVGEKANDEAWSVRQIRDWVETWKKNKEVESFSPEKAVKLLKQLKGLLSHKQLRAFLSDEACLSEEVEPENRLKLSEIARDMAKDLSYWEPMLKSTRQKIFNLAVTSEDVAA
ncbi:hypothetical protein ACFL2Q_04380 [Thermodesulfobacteriota bacterium]